MAIRQIVQVGDPVLTVKAKKVDVINGHIIQLLDDLVDTVRHANGAGLAAPQVGVRRRVCVVDVEGQLYELVNPEIIEREGEEIGLEGCLSAPGRAGLVKRPTKIKVRALDREGKEQVYEVEDFTARAFCHEIDHLDGIVYLDIMEQEVFDFEEDGEEV